MDATYDICIYKQLSPMKAAAEGYFDAYAFGYFDAIKFNKSEYTEVPHNYREDILHVFTNAEQEKFINNLQHSAVCDRVGPFCAFLTAQINPFCKMRNKIPENEQYYQKLFDELNAELTSAVNNVKCRIKKNGYFPHIEVRPFLSVGLVDFVIIFESDSLAAMAESIEEFVLQNQYCVDNNGDISCMDLCKKLFCITSSYSVYGLLTKTGCSIHSQCHKINDYDCVNGKIAAIFETFNLNSTKTSNEIAINKSTKYLSLGSSDYVYINNSSNIGKNDICELIEQAIRYNGLLGKIASSNLRFLSKVTSPSKTKTSHTDVQNETSNTDDGRSDSSINVIIKDLINKITRKTNNPSNDIKKIGIELEQMYQYCRDLDKTLFAPRIASMLLPSFTVLKSILETIRDAYPRDDATFENAPTTIYQTVGITSLRVFHDAMYQLLSSLALSTVTFIESQDYRSHYVNSYSKYLVGYYAIINKLISCSDLIDDEVVKELEIAITLCFDAKMETQALYWNLYPSLPFRLFVLPLPMMHLNNPTVLLPLILHEVGHVIKNNDNLRGSRRECIIEVVARYVLIDIFPILGIAFADCNDNSIDLVKELHIYAGEEELQLVDTSQLIVNADNKDNLSKEINKKIFGTINELYKRRLCELTTIITEFIVFNGNSKYYSAIENIVFEMLDRCCKKFESDNCKLTYNYSPNSIEMKFDGFLNELSEEIDRIKCNLIDIFSDNSFVAIDQSAIWNVSLLVELKSALENMRLKNSSLYIRKSDYIEHYRLLYPHESDASAYALPEIVGDIISTFKEILPDIFMLKMLKIEGKNQVDKYLNVYSSDILMEYRNHISISIRINMILEVYFGLKSDEIHKSIVQTLGPSNEWIYDDFHDKLPNNKCLQMHDLIGPSFAKYTQQCIDYVKGFLDNNKKYNFTQEYCAKVLTLQTDADTDAYMFRAWDLLERYSEK